MYELTKDTKQIFFSPKERAAIKNELEKVFVEVDRSSPEGMYSSDAMKIKYPMLSELHRISDF